MTGRALAIVAMALGASAPTSGEEAFRPGAYDVSYSLELPHVATQASGHATACLRDPSAHGFPVLSANNPLARCPASDVRREGDEVTFSIVCPGANAATATGRFILRAGGFEGRIAMNMGGKNMTMAEAQRGARLGDCASEAGR